MKVLNLQSSVLKKKTHTYRNKQFLKSSDNRLNVHKIRSALILSEESPEKKMFKLDLEK